MSTESQQCNALRPVVQLAFGLGWVCTINSTLYPVYSILSNKAHGTLSRVHTFVPSDHRFGYSRGFAGQFNRLSQLSCAVCQNFIKVRWTCGREFIIKDRHLWCKNTVHSGRQKQRQEYKNGWTVGLEEKSIYSNIVSI